VRRAQVRRVYPGSLRVELQEHDAVAYWGPDTGSALVNSQGEVFEANVGDVEQDGLPRLLGPAGSSPEVLQMFGLLQPVFKPLGLEVETLELTGRGGWRATLDSDAVVELGGGTPQEVVQRTQRFTRTLTQVAAQYGRRVDALESADLRHAGGYALRMRGVTTVVTDTAAAAASASAVRRR
jgi:cell division protein FtsQ